MSSGQWNPTGWIGPLRALQIESGASLIPDVPGVYIWRRGSSIPVWATGSPDDMDRALRELAAVPFLLIERLEPRQDPSLGSIERKDLVGARELRVGGGALTPARLATLRDLLDEAPVRRLVHRLLGNSMERFGPVLYVGEAGNLRVRAMDHWHARTPLRRRMEAQGLKLEECTYSCLPLEGLEVNARQAIEQLLTTLFIAPLSYRAG